MGPETDRGTAGVFVNSASPTVAEHVANCGYDWVLVDMQHGPMDPVLLSTMLCAIAKGGAKSMVRVAAYNDRSGMQQVGRTPPLHPFSSAQGPQSRPLRDLRRVRELRTGEAAPGGPRRPHCRVHCHSTDRGAA